MIWALNIGANGSNLTSANVKSHCVTDYPPINVVSERETPTNAYLINPGAKITVSTPFQR